MTFGLALALAALTGLSLELLGSGGSIITLPVMVYVAGIANRLPAMLLRRGFAWWVVLLGIALIGRNLMALVGAP